MFMARFYLSFCLASAIILTILYFGEPGLRARGVSKSKYAYQGALTSAEAIESSA